MRAFHAKLDAITVLWLFVFDSVDFEAAWRNVERKRKIHRVFGRMSFIKSTLIHTYKHTCCWNGMMQTIYRVRCRIHFGWCLKICIVNRLLNTSRYTKTNSFHLLHKIRFRFLAEKPIHSMIRCGFCTHSLSTVFNSHHKRHFHTMQMTCHCFGFFIWKTIHFTILSKMHTGNVFFFFAQHLIGIEEVYFSKILNNILIGNVAHKILDPNDTKFSYSSLLDDNFHFYYIKINNKTNKCT